MDDNVGDEWHLNSEIAFGGRAPWRPPNAKFKIRENSYFYISKNTDIHESIMHKYVNFQDGLR